jgi:hypothetical protein
MTATPGDDAGADVTDVVFNSDKYVHRLIMSAKEG